MKQNSLGIYLSIPFCKAKCSFCNFASGVFGADRLQRYVDYLCAELRAARDAAKALSAYLPERVDTVYFGGGTPSLLEPAHLSQIFETLRSEFAVEPNGEITLEAAPGQLLDRTLDAAMRLGVDRISLGVQSFVDRESAAVGRLHTGAECLQELARLRAAGVERLGLDLIAGLPLQNGASWAESLEQAVESGVDHVSIYMLEIDEDSRLGREALAGSSRYHASSLPSEDATADWYQAACGRLNAAGLAQYEISNFARPGFASRHNLKYWNRQPYLGVGLDAHSMLLCRGDDSRMMDGTMPAAIRWANVDDMDVYLGDNLVGGAAGSLRMLATLRHNSENNGRTVDRIEIDQAFEESLFLGLRLNEGVDLERLRGVFGPSRLDAVSASLHDIELAGLIWQESNMLHLTAAGRLASNEVFSRLLVA